MVVDVSAGLAHMHGLSPPLTHRDIKLENIIFLDERHKVVRIIDFGFSTRCAPDRRLRLFCGTPSYMAPEIVQQVGHGFQVDWWGLGIFLFELVENLHDPVASFDSVVSNELKPR